MVEIPDEQISMAVLRRLLGIRGESDSLDFKLTLDLGSDRDRVELARDVLAFSNTESGGHIVIGVDDKNLDPVGLKCGNRLDTTAVWKAISRYVPETIGLRAADYSLRHPDWSNDRRFAILFIPPCTDFVATPLQIGEHKRDGRGPDIRFLPGQILTRSGAQTIAAGQAAAQRLTTRSRSGVSAGLRKRRAPPLDNLPPREEIALEFVGRLNELRSLWGWLDDAYSCRWLLTGYGGKGKSAIAYQFATQVAETDSRDLLGIFWFSAKKRHFSEGKTVATASPDFHDLNSLLDAVAQAYGFEDECKLPLVEKRQAVLGLFQDLPSLLVVDDVDSLTRENDDVLQFLFDVRKSKVLLTARGVLDGFGRTHTDVAGLQGPDAAQFIRSRIDLMSLGENRFSTSAIEAIVKVTEGSPLYIEDLLRLCHVTSPDEATRAWQDRRGDEARQYSLKRELDTLDGTTKKLVLACCLRRGHISLAEMQEVTGASDDEVEQSMRKLQNLFLVPKPQLVEGVELFDVNENVRSLVLKVHEKTDTLRRLRQASERVFSTRLKDSKTTARTSAYIRQAISLERLGKLDDAEKTILAAMEENQSDADLIAQLGHLYWRWVPKPRLADARASFKRAGQLRCTRESLYKAWFAMEKEEMEWTAAAEAAECGLRNLPESPQLAYFAGYARSRLGQELLRSRNISKAEDELRRADEHLKLGLKGSRRASERTGLECRILRALVINSGAQHRGEAHLNWQKQLDDAERRAA
jgi:hypothetical protein